MNNEDWGYIALGMFMLFLGLMVIYADHNREMNKGLYDPTPMEYQKPFDK